MTQNFQKGKDAPNATGPGFRTSSSFRGNMFGRNNIRPQNGGAKFNPGQFKTQHKG